MNKAIFHIRLVVGITLFFMFLTLDKAALQAQVSISPGTWITVKEGGSVYFGTNLHIKSVADSSGYFVDQTVGGDVTITGDISVDRYMAPDIWHNVASPVSNETSSCFTGTDLVFWYDETQIWNDWNFGWVWYYGATGGPLMVGRGYDVYFDTNPVTVNYSATGTETLNTGGYNYNVTITDPTPNPVEIPSHLGWNLAGNPYPSPVDWLAASGWDKSDINDAKYIWDGENDIYTIFIGGGSPIGINGGTRFIPSNQGFWVQAAQNGTLGISNAVRIGDITGTPDFYKISPPDYPLISIIVTGNDKSDEAVIRFIEGTTGGFDINYDASKLFSPAENVPQLSIKAGNQVLAVNTLPELTDKMGISLNFQCGEPGYYTIHISERTNLEANYKLFLKDELEQKIIEIGQKFSYSFNHNPLFLTDRFILYINPDADILNNLSPGKYFSVYSNGNRITIIKQTTQEITGEIIVFSLLGQAIQKESLCNALSTSFCLNAPAGEYIVSIIAKGNTINSKIFINKL
jgi:fibronectin-binding autotransporter adhesin